ncbi:hypothetical protein HZB02_00900 [Candidatus Woesearchaeota archaeon]|nr:hypothetical protein [Candidatus Woesearchaeota archaeon]
MMHDFYQPYFEAVKRVLDGTPVTELDDIRQRCNTTFRKGVSTAVPKPASGYIPEVLIVTFAADAENRILLGADPAEVYSGFKGIAPAVCRQRGRSVLESAIHYYLK